jgi:hypothetical protein
MNHRHLLPDEIDLLLDDEVGFGVSPLRAHLRDCADCRDRVVAAKRVMEALEDVQHFAPSHAFADRVMSQVPVFVPWHVTARQSALRYVPRSRPARVMVGVTATAMASVLTALILWVATQTDALQLAGAVASGRLGSLMLDAARTVLSTMFGDQMFAIIQQAGTVGIAAALLGVAMLAAGSVFGLRALAVASSRRRA